MRLGSVAVVVGGLLAVVLVGGVAGYAAGRPDRAASLRPVEIASASPIPAHPSVPIDRVRPYAPDITYPALTADLTYTRHRITGSGHTWSYEVPVGWKRYPNLADNGTIWRPTDEPTVGGFGLRVLPIGGSRTAPQDQMRNQSFHMAQAYPDERKIRSTDDTVWYEYRSGGNLHRFNDFAWVRLPDSPYAGFELSVFGRAADQDGLDALINTVRDSVTLVR